MVDLRLVLALFLLLASTAQARPGDLDRSFGDRGRTAFLRDSGGYVAGLALVDGRRPLLSVGTGLYGNPAPRLLTLTAAGALAAVTRGGGARGAAVRRRLRADPRRRRPDAVHAGADRRERERRAHAPVPEHAVGARSLDRDLRRRRRGPHRSRPSTHSTWARSGASIARALPAGRRRSTRARPLGVSVDRLIMDSLVRRDGRHTPSPAWRGGGLRVLALDADRRPASRLPRAGAANGPLPRAGGARTDRARRPAGGCSSPAATRSTPAGSCACAPTGARPPLRRRRRCAACAASPRTRSSHDRRGRIVLAGRQHNRVYGQAGVVRLSAARPASTGASPSSSGALRGVRLIASRGALTSRSTTAGGSCSPARPTTTTTSSATTSARSYPAVARLQG